MSDLTDTARMDEAKRMMASQANTSVFLMDAELTNDGHLRSIGPQA